jgi:hypothetical protein
MMEYYNVSEDSYFNRLIDGLVILVLGVAIGVVVSQILLTKEVTTITTRSRVTKQQDALSEEHGVVEQEVNFDVDLPKGVKLEEN